LSHSDTYTEAKNTWRCSMDKISSIISSSKNPVDMSKERPVRAGAPSYGQPISPATQTFQKVQREEELLGLPQKVNSPDVARHSGIIDKITFSFRGNSERAPESVEQVVDLSSLAPPSESSSEETPGLDLYA
jgi:hypothetical protein